MKGVFMSNEFVKKEFYLKFGCTNPTRRLAVISGPWATSSKPSLKENEICIKASFNIPKSLFVKPILEITGTIPDTQTKQIELEVAESARVLLEESLGLKVSLLSEENQTLQ